MNHSDIIKNIKKNYFFNSLSFFWRFVVLGIIIAFAFYYLFIDADFTFAKYSFIEIALYSFIGICIMGSFAYFLKKFIKNFYYYIYPSKSIDNEIDSIFDEIFSSIEYQDNEVIISQKYMLSKKDYRLLVNLDDVLIVYIREHKTNFVTDSYGIVVVDNHNNSYFYPNPKEAVNNILNILLYKCKNAKFGYTDENFKYAMQNTINSNNDEKINESFPLKLVIAVCVIFAIIIFLKFLQ